MKCPKCQSENPDRNQFCVKCGTPLQATSLFSSNESQKRQTVQNCPHCAHPNPAGSLYCENCGRSLNPSADSGLNHQDSSGSGKKKTQAGIWVAVIVLVIGLGIAGGWWLSGAGTNSADDLSAEKSGKKTETGDKKEAESELSDENKNNKKESEKTENTESEQSQIEYSDSVSGIYLDPDYQSITPGKATGPAIMELVLDYKGVSASQSSLASQAGTGSDGVTDYSAVSKVLNSELSGRGVSHLYSGLYLEPDEISYEQENLMFERLKSALDEDMLPVIVLGKQADPDLKGSVYAAVSGTDGDEFEVIIPVSGRMVSRTFSRSELYDYMTSAGFLCYIS